MGVNPIWNYISILCHQHTKFIVVLVMNGGYTRIEKVGYVHLPTKRKEEHNMKRLILTLMAAAVLLVGCAPSASAQETTAFTFDAYVVGVYDGDFDVDWIGSSTYELTDDLGYMFRVSSDMNEFLDVYAIQFGATQNVTPTVWAYGAAGWMNCFDMYGEVLSAGLVWVSDTSDFTVSAGYDSQRDLVVGIGGSF